MRVDYLHLYYWILAKLST
nr:unnamed protein product [Callosobruchus analis]